MTIGDDEGDPPLLKPGARPWLISCDESGTHGARFYGFGSLWMSWDRRGEFARDIETIATKYDMKIGVDERGVAHEFKWAKVKPQKIEFYKELVEYFFRKPWLLFHCIVVRRAIVRTADHDGGLEEAHHKHFTMLLTNKIERALRSNRDRKFRIWVDPIPSSYERQHEVVEIISNAVLEKQFGKKLKPVDKVVVHESHETPTIQLCDLLLGATMAAWQEKAKGGGKVKLQSWIAHHLGWPDLRADTAVSERKFNVWYFYDPTLGEREVQTRPVRAKYPLPRVH